MEENVKVSEIVAYFIKNTLFDDLPLQVVKTIKLCVLDTIGVIVAANTLGQCTGEIIKLLNWEERSESTVLGFGKKVPALWAAFANGAMAHMLDFEEAHDLALVHASACSIPAALAVAEAIGGVSGKDFITALAVGNEICIRAGLAMLEADRELWYLPPILGALGATAAVAKILNLDTGAILSAFSFLLCQASCSAEIVYTNESDVRAIRDGFASKAAVFSCYLAQSGLKGFKSPLEGRAGFFSLYSSGRFSLERFTRDLGARYYVESTSFKPWPCCRGIHSYIEAALKVRENLRLPSRKIVRISVKISPHNVMLCEPFENRSNPKTSIEAKFSLPYVVSLSINRGKVTLEDFINMELAREEKELIKKFYYEIDSTLSPTSGWLEVETEDGMRESAYVKFPLGSPQNPLSEDFLLKKFFCCCQYSAKDLRDDDIAAISDMVLNLERVGNVSIITSLL